MPERWNHIFQQDIPVLELFVRGTLLYFAILLMLRLMPRRTAGEMASMDLIFIFLIAESAAHALDVFTSVVDGLVLIITLMLWNFLLNWLSYRIPLVERLTSARPLLVVHKGKLLRGNMRREFLTEEELMEQLRRQGVDDLNIVKSAYVEAAGDITVVRESHSHQ